LENLTSSFVWVWEVGRRAGQINDSMLNVQISATADFWLDLNTIEDEAWKAEFLKYFGLTLK
jgi:hypothetical protein